LKPTLLGQTFLYKEGIEVFEVGQADQLGDVGVVPDVALFIRVGLAPHGGGDAEKGHVENIRFRGVDLVDRKRQLKYTPAMGGLS